MLTRVEQELIDRRLFNGADDCAGFFDRFRKSLEIRKRPGASHRHLFLANVLSDRRFSIEGGVAQNKGASLSGSGQGGGPSKRYRRMWWGSTSSMPRIGPEGGAELASRATDETGYVQPTRRQLIDARGRGSLPYHLNSIVSWLVQADGRVIYKAEPWA